MLSVEKESNNSLNVVTTRNSLISPQPLSSNRLHSFLITHTFKDHLILAIKTNFQVLFFVLNSSGLNQIFNLTFSSKFFLSTWLRLTHSLRSCKWGRRWNLLFSPSFPPLLSRPRISGGPGVEELTRIEVKGLKSLHFLNWQHSLGWCPKMEHTLGCSYGFWKGLMGISIGSESGAPKWGCCGSPLPWLGGIKALPAHLQLHCPSNSAQWIKSSWLVFFFF